MQVNRNILLVERIGALDIRFAGIGTSWWPVWHLWLIVVMVSESRLVAYRWLVGREGWHRRKGLTRDCGCHRISVSLLCLASSILESLDNHNCDDDKDSHDRDNDKDIDRVLFNALAGAQLVSVAT